MIFQLAALLRIGWGILLLAVLAPHCSWAHGIVGERMFVEPLFTEDANVKNELVLPFAGFSVQPDGTWRRIGFSLEKQLYPNRLSVVFETGRLYRHDGTGNQDGWDNLEAGVKFQAYTNERREFVLSPALFLTFPTSSERVAEHETSVTPMLLFGKGFGDMAPGWLRPFAIQSDLGITTSIKHPRDREFLYDVAVVYSIPYLNHSVRKADSGYSLEQSLRQGFSAGALWGNLFPFVEFNGSRSFGSASGVVTSSLRPGILWMGKYVQMSLAADLPIQSEGPVHSRHRGICASLDWFLDEIFPVLNWTPFGNSHRHQD